MLKVLVLAPALHDTSPGMRFRIEQWARHLEPAGVAFTFASFEDAALHRVIYARGQYARKAWLITRSLLRRLAWLPRIRDFDVVLLHREAAILGPAVLEWLIARRKVPIVYDFDDPIWLPYRSPTHGMLSYLKCPGKVAGICRLARIVTAGNRLLADWARQHASAVEVVPSTVDLDAYTLTPVERPDPVTLGWTGSHSTLPFLDSLLPTLRRLATRLTYRLLVISHTDAYQPESLPVEVRSRRWQAATEVQDLCEADIGLAPFPDSGWTPWRCHGKVLQYMASAIPTVASSIGILPEYIQNSETGFLARNEDEWIDCLTRLAEDRGLRQRMGRAGREVIAERYSIQHWAPRIRQVLERAVSGGWETTNHTNHTNAATTPVSR